MGDITQNFSFCEFKCLCGKCSYVDGYQIDQNLVRELQVVRDGFGKSMHINSALRCVDHNRSVGSSINSYHLLGRACDVAVSSSVDRHILCKLVLAQGLTLGISKNFIHIDNRDIPIIFLY